MSLQHFYLESQLISAVSDEEFTLELSSEDSKHARVLRLKPGEHIALVDAAQDYFECELISCDQGIYTARIAQRLDASLSPRVVLVQGMSKGEKMDLVFRHATELSVDGFVPLMCERSIVKLDAKKEAARLKRWNSILKSAATQSGQPRIPWLSNCVNSSSLVSALHYAKAVLVCWEQAETTKTINKALDGVVPSYEPVKACKGASRNPDAGELGHFLQDAIVVIVGPEGGLTEDEVQALLSSNDHAELVSLGRSILRTETAGIVAPALVLYELGGMQ